MAKTERVKKKKKKKKKMKMKMKKKKKKEPYKRISERDPISVSDPKTLNQEDLD